MLLVGFSFVLKLTYHSLIGTVTMCAVAALFVGLVWEFAAGQSKTQIADWLENPELMLDIAVLLTIDVFFQITFCIMKAKGLSGEGLTRSERLIGTVTLWFPGLLIFPTLFAILVEMIFSFPGMDFATLAWSTAIAVAVIAAVMAFALRWALPESELRLELMFMLNAMIAILGVIATVNGRTAVKGTDSVEWGALAGILVIIAAGAVAGLIIYRYRTNKQISQLK